MDHTRFLFQEGPVKSYIPRSMNRLGDKSQLLRGLSTQVSTIEEVVLPHLLKLRYFVVVSSGAFHVYHCEDADHCFSIVSARGTLHTTRRVLRCC